MTTQEARLEQNLHPEGLTAGQEAFADSLLRFGLVMFGDRKIKFHKQHPEAPLSPIYIDLRPLRRLPDEKREALRLYRDQLVKLDFDLIADVPTAGTPFASSLSDRFVKGMITPRLDNKQYGSGAQIDGLLSQDKGMTAVLIDDLITDGNSKIEAVNILRQNGIKVNDVVVLIDRNQGGREELEKEGIRLHASMTLDQMLDYYARTGKITQEILAHTKKGLVKITKFIEKTKSR